MTQKEILERFASNFVLKEYQSRCVFDALKNPEKMMRKICHSISEVFPKHFKQDVINFTKNDVCLFYNLIGHMEEITWDEAYNKIQMHGGGGYLIIGINEDKFYAQSEGYPPTEIYAGIAK